MDLPVTTVKCIVPHEVGVALDLLQQMHCTQEFKPIYTVFELTTGIRGKYPTSVTTTQVADICSTLCKGGALSRASNADSSFMLSAALNRFTVSNLLKCFGYDYLRSYTGEMPWASDKIAAIIDQKLRSNFVVWLF